MRYLSPRVRRSLLLAVFIGSGLATIVQTPANAVFPVCSIDALTPEAIEVNRVDVPTGGYFKRYEVNAVSVSWCRDDQSPYPAKEVTVLRTSARLVAHQTGFAPTPMNDVENIQEDVSEGFAVAGVPGCPPGRTEWSNQGEVQWVDYETGSYGGPRNDTSGRITTVCTHIPIQPLPAPQPPPEA